ncbi:MAG: MarR family transcriptional regulator [Woeseia sp.]|jgi:DNA-binding MarR family transcriptional regulator|nr:MarR family transcriptional regulator [Woeseia sp.]
MSDSTINQDRDIAAVLENFELESFVPYLLNQAMGQLKNVLHQTLKPHGLSIHQWRVMIMLRLRGSVSIGEISAHTVMGQSTITRVADQLERAGLARREPLKNNNRIILLCLTDSGSELIEHVLPLVIAINEAALQGIDDKEQQLLFRLLEKVATNTRRYGARQEFELDEWHGRQARAIAS